MTVQELIDALAYCDPAYQVVVRGYASGVNSVTYLMVTNFAPLVGSKPCD